LDEVVGSGRQYGWVKVASQCGLLVAMPPPTLCPADLAKLARIRSFRLVRWWSVGYGIGIEIAKPLTLGLAASRVGKEGLVKFETG